MAGKYDEYEKILYGKKSGTTQLAKNQKTLNNLKTRLAAGGVNPEEETDSRNWLEKALNLKKDQNAIFDVFELLNRPQQSLFGAIRNFQEGEDVLKGLKEGISGEKTTEFKDILKNTGGFEDREGKMDLVDVLGFAGDVFLDPMDIPLIPVSAASKTAKAVDTVSDIARVADKASDVAKVADTASDVAKAANVVDNISDVAKATEFISPTQWLGRTAKKGVKSAANLADTGLEKLLTKLDEAKGIQYLQPDSKWASELGKIGNETGKLEIYKGLKNNITTMFDTKLSKAARQSQKVNEAKEFMTDVYLNDKYANIENKLKNYASKLNMSVEDLDKIANNAIDVVDEIPMRSVIEGAKDGTIKYSDTIYNKLIDIANDVPDDTEKLINGIKKGKYGVLELSEDWDKVFDKFDVEKLNSKVKRASFLTKKEQKEAVKFLQENAPDLLEDFKNFYNDANEFISNPENFSSMEGLKEKFLENNIEGFSKHRLAGNYETNIKKLGTDYGVDLKEIDKYLPQGPSNVGIGSRTLSSRKYNMPATEANLLRKRELLTIPGLSKEAKNFIKNDINLFETGATAGVQSYIDQMPKLAKNTQVFNEVLFKQGFGDLKEMSSLKKAINEGTNVVENTEKLNKLLDNSPFRVVEGGKTPYGFKRLDSDMKDKIVNFMYSTGNKSGSKELVENAGKLKNLFDYGGDIAVDPTVLNIIKFNADNTAKSEFSKMYNKLMNFFKKNSTSSVTNQMNNITGNWMNMSMSGMKSNDIVKYSSQAIKDLNNWEDILRKGITDASQLSDDEIKIYNRLKGFMENVTTPDKASILRKYDIGDIAKDLNKKGNKNLYDKYVDFFASLNASEDRVFKYAMYNYAMDNPKFMRNLGIESVDELGKALTAEQMAGRAVNKVLFDPSDLTAFEQGTMKNIIPFYTFTKKNLAFQISNMGDNLQNYNKLMKGYNSLLRSYDGNEENIATYLKENMYIPIPGLDENGDYKFFRAQLPFGDLTDMISDPLGSLVNRSNPFAKAIYENVANVNTLNGNKIEKFPRQKGNISILNDIPILNKAKFQQTVGNLSGLNTMLRQIDRGVQGYQKEGPLGILTGNTTISGNVNTDKLSKTYSQIEELQNLMKQYEQKGYQFSTMSELKKANKNGTIEGLNAIFAKYGIDVGNNSNSPYSEYEKLLYGK